MRYSDLNRFIIRRSAAVTFILSVMLAAATLVGGRMDTGIVIASISQYTANSVFNRIVFVDTSRTTSVFYDIPDVSAQVVLIDTDGRSALAIGGEIRDTRVTVINLRSLVTTTITGESDLYFSPDGTLVTFKIPQYTDSETFTPGIYVANLGNGTITELSSRGEDYEWTPANRPSWSSDNRLSYAVWGNAYISGPNASYPQRIDPQFEDYVIAANISPDANWLVTITYVDDRDTYNLYFSRADGVDRRLIASGMVDAPVRQWSPDSTRLLFYLNMGETMSTHILETATGGNETLDLNERYDGTYGVGEIVWSSDSQMVAMVVGNQGLHVDLYDRSGNFIGTAHNSGRFPSWSPNGAYLAVEALIPGAIEQLAVVDVNAIAGGVQTQSAIIRTISAYRRSIRYKVGLWTSDNHLVFLVHLPRGRNAIYSYNPITDTIRALTQPSFRINSFAVAPEGGF